MPLKWTREPKSLKVSLGKSVKVPCQARGSPTPTIKWRKVDSVQYHHQTNSNKQQQQQQLGAELSIASVGQQDAGLYECTASNQLDSELSAIISLEVVGKFSFVSTNKQQVNSSSVVGQVNDGCWSCT